MKTLTLAWAVPLLGCGSDATFVWAPWSEDQIGVVVFATDDRVERQAIAGPGAAARVSIPSTRGRLFARGYAGSRTASDGTPLWECTVTVGGLGALLPPPTGAWVTDVFESPDSPPPFARESEPLRVLDLRSESCTFDPDPCRFVAVEPVADILDFEILAAASTGEGRLWVGGRRRTAPVAPVLVYIEDGRVEDRSALVASIGAVHSLAAVSSERLLGIGAQRTLFTLGPTGVGPAPRIRDVIRLAGSPGFDAFTFTSTVVFELNATEVVDTFGFGARIDGVFRYRERAWVLTENQLLVRSEGIWQPEEVTLPAGSAQLGGDGDVIVATGGRGIVVARQGADPSWQSFAPPANGSHPLRVAGGLGSGRFVVAGQDLLAVWTEDGWCATDDPVDYRVAATDPGLPQTWVMGNLREGARILKVSLRGE